MCFNLYYISKSCNNRKLVIEIIEGGVVDHKIDVMCSFQIKTGNTYQIVSNNNL